MATWVEDIIQAMMNLGGQASLAQIYSEVERIRTSPLSPSFKATIRRELQSWSAVSINYQGRKDYFKNIDKGVWALKEQISDDYLEDVKIGQAKNYDTEIKNSVVEQMATWLDDIKQALTNLGGQGTLNEIYQETKRIRKGDLPNLWQHIIQDTIYENSSDTLKFKGKDLFRKVSKGVWALREHTPQVEIINNISAIEKDRNYETENKMVVDNGLFLGKEMFNFSIKEPIETITNLYQTIKEYREYAKVEDVTEWFEYIHQIFHIFGFDTKNISKRLITLQDFAGNQNPKALICIVGPNENFHEIAFEVTWESYLFYAAKFYKLEWVILTNGLQFKVINCSEDINDHKYFQCEFDEIIKNGHLDSFFAIYKIFNLINKGTNKIPNSVVGGGKGEAGAGGKIIPERDIKRKEFWTQMIMRSKSKTKLFNKKSPGADNYFGISAGRKGLTFSCNINYDNARIQIYIDNGSFDWNKSTFDHFYQNKDKIEKALGNSLIWDRLENNRASVIRLHLLEKGLKNTEAWPEIQDVFIENMMKIEEVFRPYINNLPK